MRESWKDPSIVSLHNFGICFVIKKKRKYFILRVQVFNIKYYLNTSFSIIYNEIWLKILKILKQSKAI